MWDKVKRFFAHGHTHDHDKHKPALFRREPRRFWYALGALACVAMLVIAFQGNLGYYIHPRYHTFTVLMIAVAAVFLLVATVQYTYKKQTDIEFSSFGELVWLFGRWLFGKGAWIVVVATGLLLFVPAAPLMADAAARRGASSAQLEYVTSAPWFYEPEGVYQLSAVLGTSEGMQRYQGETFTVSGFVREDTDRDMMRVSRFVIACCTVDASPRDILVHAPGWQNHFERNDWVEVRGTVDLVNIGAAHEPVLRAVDIKPIEQPDDPYEYL